MNEESLDDDQPIRDFRDLKAWQLSIELACQVYQHTASYPSSELYGLTNQTRRSAISVPTNIAEGNGRGSRTDYLRFLRIAGGSLSELQTQLILAEKLGYAPIPRELSEGLRTAQRILAGLIKSLEDGRG